MDEDSLPEGALPEEMCGDPRGHEPHDWLRDGYGSTEYRYCDGVGTVDG
jgi:hypothetical protein